jgi:hypothetical protein
MRNNIFLVLTVAAAVIFAQFLSYFGLSYWLVLLLIPVSTYVQMYTASRYNFRKSLRPEPIPENGYEKRLNDLEMNRHELESLGFIKFDEFYLKLSVDAVLYAYYHEKYPIELCDYHFGQANCRDLTSNFGNDNTLTTTNASSAGQFPRPPENLMQVFPRKTISELFKHHLEAGKFLTNNGYQVEQPLRETFRSRFMTSFMKSGELLFTGLLSPIKVFYWVKINKNNKYLKGIEEQFLAKTLQLQ